MIAEDIPESFILKKEEKEEDKDKDNQNENQKEVKKDDNLGFGLVNIEDIMNSQPPTKKDPPKCYICNQQFSTHHYVQLHIRTIHVGDRPYACNTCPERFKLRFTLEQHLRLHEGTRPYECPKCKMTFTQQGTMDCHARSVHKYWIARRRWTRRSGQGTDDSGGGTSARGFRRNNKDKGKGVVKKENIKMEAKGSLKLKQKKKKEKPEYRCDNCCFRFSSKEELQNHGNVCGQRSQGRTIPRRQQLEMKAEVEDNQGQSGTSGKRKNENKTLRRRAKVKLSQQRQKERLQVNAGTTTTTPQPQVALVDIDMIKNETEDPAEEEDKSTHQNLVVTDNATASSCSTGSTIIGAVYKDEKLNEGKHWKKKLILAELNNSTIRSKDNVPGQEGPNNVENNPCSYQMIGK